MDCITFVTEMSKTDCEAAIAKPEYVKALQEALTTELTKVIKTQSNGDYVSKHRPSIWCGSLVMQAVVGETFASELQKHYTSGNALELQVEGKALPFKPQSTTTSTTISTTTSSTTVSTTTTKPALRTTTAGKPTDTTSTPRNAQDQAIEEEPNGVMIGVALTGSIVTVVVVVLVVVLVCTKNNGEGKGKGSADEDIDTYHVTPQTMSDDPNEVSLEMGCMTSSDVNHKKEDNQKAEVEPKPEPENENDAGAKPTSDNPQSTVENSV